MPQPPICAGICDSAEPWNRKDRRAGKVLGLAAVRSLFGIEHLREYHLHLVSRGITANSICVKMTALRFFYGTTLRRPDIVGQIPPPVGSSAHCSRTRGGHPVLLMLCDATGEPKTS
jgi:hypothetical protein